MPTGTPALPLLLCILCGGGAAAGTGRLTWPWQQQLRSRAPPLPALNRGVLGNLRNASQVAGRLRVPRNHLFVASITVGTPPQAQRCLLDTASADLWIPSKRCEGCENELHFHADKSSTFMPAVARTPQGLKPVPVQTAYGSGEILGFLVQDTIGFGSMGFTNQSFIIVEEESLPKHRSWDGICGLGWRQMAAAGEPLYRHLQKEGGHALFALVPSSGGQAYMKVGEVPLEACRGGTLAWSTAEPLKSDGPRSFWVTSGGLLIGEEPFVKTRFLVDTGTPFMLAPRKHYTKIMRSLLTKQVFDNMCGVDVAAGNLVVCDCSILKSPEVLRGQAAGAQDLVRLRLGDRLFGLRLSELFKRAPTSNGAGELCLPQIQHNPMSTTDPLDLLAQLLRGGGLPIGGSPLAASGGHGPHKGGPAAHGAALLPFAFNPLKGVPMAGKGEQVEEIVQTRGDGSVCKTELVWKHGHLKTNRTHCGKPKGVTVRRLQGDQAYGVLPATVQDPMEDLWVLGGAFLKHYVTVLDFEHGRIGFAEPAIQAAAAVPAPSLIPVGSGLRTLMGPGDQKVDTSQDGHRGGTFPWGKVLFAGVLVSGVVGLATLSNKMSRRKNAAPPAPGEVEEDPDPLAAE